MSAQARERRKAKGFSQKSLADQFGLSDNYIGLLERGDVAKLNQDNVEKILSFLGLALSEFAKREPVPVEKIHPRPEPQAPTSPGWSAPHQRPPERRPGYDRPATAVPPRKFEVAAERMPPKAPPSGQLKQFTGKELQRHAEWVRFRTRITIKLVNGEELEGYLKWTDQFSVKLVGRDSEYVIPKHSILYYAEAPRQRWNGPRGR